MRTLAVACLAMLGCVPQARRADVALLQARASFDLGCPYHDLSLYHFDERAKGVSGCGRRLTYVEQCDRERCTWMLDTPTFEQQQWPGQLASRRPASAPVATLPCVDRMCADPAATRTPPEPSPAGELIDRGF